MYCNKRTGFTEIQQADHELNRISVSDDKPTATKYNINKARLLELEF